MSRCNKAPACSVSWAAENDLVKTTGSPPKRALKSHHHSSSSSETHSLFGDFDTGEISYVISPEVDSQALRVQFHWVDYLAFVVIGTACLWPWNCFLSAAPYFHSRFEASPFLRDNITSFIMTISTVTSTVFNLHLSHRQIKANYVQRYIQSNVINGVVFSILTLSCGFWVSIPLEAYFVYILISVFFSSVGASLGQNGIFAILHKLPVAYTQALMVGQSLAGVLPASVLILSTLYASDNNNRNGSGNGNGNGNSPLGTMIYFSTAALISLAGLMLFYTISRRNRHILTPTHPGASNKEKVHIPLTTLAWYLKAPALAIVLVFSFSLIFPVFASAVMPINPSSSSLFSDPGLFIPLAFLVWNLGDLAGRSMCAWSSFLIRTPRIMLGYGLVRVGFVAVLLFMCNVKGRGAAFGGDGFYMIILFLFGLTNGHLSSSCMMVAPSFVPEPMKEAAGGFMILCLSVGLAMGSILSFVFVRLIK